VSKALYSREKNYALPSEVRFTILILILTGRLSNMAKASIPQVAVVKQTAPKTVAKKTTSSPPADNPYGEEKFRNGIVIPVTVVKHADGTETVLKFGERKVRKYVQHEAAIAAAAKGKVLDGYTVTKFKGRDILSVEGDEKGGVCSMNKASALNAGMPRMKAYLKWKGESP